MFNFDVILELWYGVWDTFTAVFGFVTSDLLLYVEIFFNRFNDFLPGVPDIDIPYQISIVEFLTTPLLFVALALGTVAFIYSCIRDIISPWL